MIYSHKHCVKLLMIIGASMPSSGYGDAAAVNAVNDPSAIKSRKLTK